jgi:diguanylate cyclase (GGDEF)-like protein
VQKFYTSWLVALSFGVAILVSYAALRLAARVAAGERGSARIWLAAGALAMGVGIWSMHFIGMLALSLSIPLAYDVPTTLLSLAIAVLTSGFALLLTSGASLTTARLSWGALIMGAGISAMHYTGMAATRFAQGSYCRGAVTLNNGWLAGSVGLFALGLLIVTLITALYDAHLQSRTRSHALRLEAVNAQLQHQATHDALTALPNRLLFMDRLGRELARAERDGHGFAVFLLDLDRFKLINDTLGHGTGDRLLALVARRLTANLREVDTVARTGGDEFLVLITGTRDESIVASIAAKKRPAQGFVAQSNAGPLPAEERCDDGAHQQRRSAVALATSDSRPRQSRGVHSLGRRMRVDFAHRRVGFTRILPSSQVVAAGRVALFASGRQCFSGTISAE